MVVVTGQVAYSSIGTDAFQEADTTRDHDAGHQAQLAHHRRPADIPQVVREAFHVATTGRPGPVLIDLPKDVANATMDWYWPESVDLPGYKPTTKGHPKQIRDAARLICESTRPVIYAGGGILARPCRRGAARARRAGRRPGGDDADGARRLPRRARALPRDARYARQLHGDHRDAAGSDLLITFGARFDDRVTGKVSAFAPEAKVIHVDIDPAELGKVRQPDVPIVGDCRIVIEELVKAVRAEHTKHGRPDLSEWIAQVQRVEERLPDRDHVRPTTARSRRSSASTCSAANTPDDTIVVSGVGQHQMFTSQIWQFNHPYTWVNSGGLGTMGYGVPAAIGAKVGQPDRMVWAVDGDGCFQMTAQELVTATAERIPVKIAILNNAYLGMVRQWQELFYEERYSEVYLSPDLPDYVKWAEAMGCVAMRVDTPEDVVPAIEKANEINDRPVVIEFRVD